ncbi:gamma-glutamyltransferase [Clostridium cochlearium]|uniref:gamma-glutamyltransferase n=1 Tax=Clostridium cochlearium TaxID=1494 RepID=UPI000B94D120|nr:gamma-glutamyltransferase [Clostridium cochlearium]MBV1819210.1 gamma-glutamyltransferase [Bacteroidales bacterium MSK.15.36]MBU5269917.1 gamma-glutamyltransferase [Clostridium cochlearium]MCG4580904.1 gamma-glutamyltransferase [Clostridium cochlearium]SNV68258.1 gamma-glutamyltranspeptidase [Clostridium cochlearium]STA91695.1 gamma-glutamyltranspeptidase [Clostridium cochlearium]
MKKQPKKKLLICISMMLVLVFSMSFTACGNKPQEDNKEKQQEQKEDKSSKRDAKGKNGVVASAKPEASQVGVDIMKKGGNAIDAAVATAFALGVVEPNASGIGGGGFMLVRFAKTGEEVFLDFREVAPGKATPDMYKLDDKGKVVNNESVIGGKSVAVPGDVAGLLMALEKYGTMSREEVMQPAIDLAENGFKVTENFSNMIKDNFDNINKFEATKAIYLKDGLPFEEGDTITNKDLSNTLKIIAKEGKDAFYKGKIAESIVNEVQKQGGIITLEDLAKYEVKVRKPVKGTYKGYEIVSAPPSSSGGAHVIQLLNIMENYDLKSMGVNTEQSLHAWSEASKLIFADRGKYMADTDFVKVPLAGLTSKDYAKELYEKIDKDKATQKVEAGNPNKYESGSTTHYSIMDKEGNMVAVTKTINHFFGSCVAVPGTGILLNDEMDDFDFKPGLSNSIEPGKKPLSSMTPTLILKDGKPFMTIGSPGATRIIPTVAQVISNIVDHGMDIQEAINTPRMYDKDGKLSLEGGIDEKVIEGLKNKGHEVDIKGEYDLFFGGVQGVMMESSGELHGGADPRRDGQAVGF